MNQVLDVDQCPLPRPEEMITALAGGKHFTNLDLSHAYNQLRLDQDSREYILINTRKGLYGYTHLPFEVMCAYLSSRLGEVVPPI